MTLWRKIRTFGHILSGTSGAAIRFERFPNISFFQIGEIGRQLLNCASRRERLQDRPNGHAHSADARLAALNLGIERNSKELTRATRIARQDQAGYRTTSSSAGRSAIAASK